MLRQLVWLLGPIFIKEVVEIARRWRYYISRVLYALTLLVVIVAVWEDSRWYLRDGSLNARALMVRHLFEAASMVQFGAVFLFVPMFLCGTIAGEREEHTLDVLFTTHLTDREIVLGKLGSRAAAMLCLILCGMPVLSLMMLYGGGVTPEALWRVLASTLLAMLYAGAHAMYFSVTTSTTLAALVRTYWWMALWLMGLPGLVGLIVDNAPRSVGEMAIGILVFINPIFAFAAAVEGSFYNLVARYFGPWFFPATFLLPAALSLLLLWRAVARLRHEPTPVLRWVKRLPVVRRLWQRWHRPEAMARRRAVAHRTWRGRAVENPVWLRARLAPIYDRTGHIGLIQWGGCALVLFVIAMVALFEPRELDEDEMSMGFLGPTWGAIAALAALLAGTSLVGDRRRGFLELVLVTPLTGRAIVDGTYLAVWEHLRPLLYLPFVIGPLFCLTGASHPLGVIASFITAALYCALVTWHGIACSLAARTIPAALVATFLLPLVTIAGTGLFIGMFQRAHGPAFWVLCPIFLAITWQWTRRRLTVASIACHVTAVHLAMAGLATFWAFNGRDEEYPLAAMHAPFLVLVTLDRRLDDVFRGVGQHWPVLLAFYWLALVVNVIWLRSWVIRHFDRLAERTSENSAATLECGGSTPLWMGDVAQSKAVSSHRTN